MPVTYGYLSSSQQLPDDCRNDTTLEYFMKAPEFVRVIENRTAGTIRHREGNRIKEYKADDARALKEAKAFGVSLEEGRHLSVIEQFLSALQPGSVLMFTSIEEFSGSSEIALYLYGKMSSEGIRLQFLKEPWLDNDIYRIGSKEYSGMETIIQRIISVTYESNDQKKSYLTVLSRTESNKAKKNELVK